MRKIIAAINMTIDGFCDHTAVDADDELHQHYTELLRQAGIILYGRITYGLMEYWRTVADNPTGNKETDEFALIMDKVPKLVFSRTLKQVEWESAKLAVGTLGEEVSALKQQTGKDVLIGSPSLIVSLLNLDLVDELQLCIHPVIVGTGLPLFKDIENRVRLKLLQTKTFLGGAKVLFYEPAKNAAK